MKATTLTVVAAVVLTAAAAGLWSARDLIWPPEAAAGHDHASHGGVYICGMHPDVVSDEPGTCPICGMRLSRREAPAERRILYWRAPMDPNYRAGRPGKSPMGMDLVPVYADAAGGGGIRVSPRFLQNFGVRTTEVRRGELPITVRTVGVLAHNEEKVHSVNTKFEGWIEDARINNIGEPVEKGEVLFDIYSPELVTTQREYLAAMDYLERLEAGDAYPEAIERARSLLAAARERLRYRDISEPEIEALEASRTASRTVSFLSPASGIVVDKTVDSLEGAKLLPGVTVLKIADHSTLWAQADFFEEDLRHVSEGSPARVEVPAFPDRRWDGRILFFRSAVNSSTHTLTAYIEVANPDLFLRPMMYVDVTVAGEGAADALIVPAEAVLHSGTRAVVIVERPDGSFEPREVVPGLAADDRQEIASGLSEGERIVISSQFLIDSESNLRAAIAGIAGGGDGDGR